MKTLAACLAMAMVWSTLSCQRAEKKPDATIGIDVTSPGLPMSPTMYGIFFEDINHAADGGLYAELIQNRDFEYNRVPEEMHWKDDSTIVNENGWTEKYRKPEDLFAWSLIEEGGASCRISLERMNPLNPTNSQSLRMEVHTLGTGRVAVANDGYWGIPVRKGMRYNLSLYARKDARSAGTLTASLEGRHGQRYASQQLTSVTTKWQKFTATLVSEGNDTLARLILAPGSTGTMWFDVVSLFPAETWKDRPGGMRKDLAGMLADLRPSFLRFPGGCVVEGATIENRFQWKRTIGDVSRRPGHWNLWGYRTTDGLGFHEFLQLCEDLGAVPLYVINVGMACQGRGEIVAKGRANDFLQEALDALEYAMGPVTSKWGALRQENGHPAPFTIKYVEIGNENHGPDYQEAYRIIQSGIKRKYPEITTIANYDDVRLSEQDRMKYPGVSLEMSDEHYYASPQFFYDQSSRYDSYSRSDSVKIYVGEFAVTEGKPGTGNLRAALGEAAFMVGLERNADLVQMASYAPTFVNVHNRTWSPDMIVYNNSQAYGTPSYHALKMFSSNRPDRVLPTTVRFEGDDSETRWTNLRGGIGLGAWTSTVEYKDVRVEVDGSTLLRDDFSIGTAQWTQKKDTWNVVDGALRNSNTVTEALATTGDTTWTDYVLSVKARKLAGTEGFLISFLVNGENRCLWNIGGWGNSVDFLAQYRNGMRVDLGTWRQCSIETGRWYDIRIEVKNRRVQCYLDGQLRRDEPLRPRVVSSVFATSGVQDGSGELIVKVVNPLSLAKVCTIELKGSAAVLPDGEALVLTSLSPDDENSFEKPEQVSPQSLKLSGLGSTFDYTCPAHSVSVLKVKTKR
jgi:alpha-L-arabinofuranosidase